MNWLSAFAALLKIALWAVRFIDRKQIEEAEQRGEDMGVVKAFLQWKEELDARLAGAAAARADAERVRIDPEADPNDRANQR